MQLGTIATLQAGKYGTARLGRQATLLLAALRFVMVDAPPWPAVLLRTPPHPIGRATLAYGAEAPGKIETRTGASGAARRRGHGAHRQTDRPHHRSRARRPRRHRSQGVPCHARGD